MHVGHSLDLHQQCLLRRFQTCNTIRTNAKFATQISPKIKIDFSVTKQLNIFEEASAVFSLQ